ncbi:sugar-binding transcriptional regulator [Hutsoniella sourekii]|uniref:sugar-binding transcriptional regulator n=1 Tax=Hutsoniella sourekii TaxID=87650 RepID=UPI000481A4C9|nr:sugar-binding transcriptional regulator [Hutsoniella sourekii]
MDTIEEKELVRIAKMYYEEGLTQAAIAKEVGVSRSLISKLLMDAKRQGIVEVFIKSSSSYIVELERELEKNFGLVKAIVVDSLSVKDEEVNKSASQQAALYLKKMAADHPNIGISWGYSIRGMVDSFPYSNLSEVTLIPLIGGMSDDYFSIHSNQLCFDLSQKIRSNVKYLYSPAQVSNDRIKDELINNNAIKSVLDSARNVDLAVVGISSPYEQSTMQKIGYLNEDNVEDLIKHNVVGDINSAFFDSNGQQVDFDQNRNVIGLSLDELKEIPLRMSIATSQSKTKPLAVALEHKLLNIIVTTDKLAENILKTNAI